MLLIALLWIALFVPGHALARRLGLGLASVPPPSAAPRGPEETSLSAALAGGLLGDIALAYLATLLVLSPISMACYAFDAPLWAFSAGVVAVWIAGAIELVRTGAARALWATIRREPPLPWLLLAALLFLQVRVGGYFEGDATFHLGRVRVLLEHGFSNRDIYLADYHFQSIYHTNLLYPLYGSLAQLSGESYLAMWFHSQVWAKLLVAAGHFALAYAVTQRPLAGWLLALMVITANAGETYTLYPNSLAVGYLLPLMLAAGYALLAREAPRGSVGLLAATGFVLAQVHALYALYAGLLLGPALAVVAGGSLTVFAVTRTRASAGSGSHETWAQRAFRSAAAARPPLRRLAIGLVCLFIAAPFLVVSRYGTPRTLLAHLFPATEEVESSPPKTPGTAATRAEPPSAPAPPSASQFSRPIPDNRKGQPIVPTPAVTLGGGHLEKVLQYDEATRRFWFLPEHMGGRGFIGLGFASFMVALVCSRTRRVPLAAAALGGLSLCALFFPGTATFLLQFLEQPFTVARLSTLLSSLLLLGIAAALAELCARVPAARRAVDAQGASGGSLELESIGAPTQSKRAELSWWTRLSLSRIVAAVVIVLAVAAATRLTGHAPVFFSELVSKALEPGERRYAKLDQLEARRALLQRVIPRGATVLTTARFARYVVMLCDCYVIAADRGHTGVGFIKERREHLVRLNGSLTPWSQRVELLRRYDLELVVFESRHLRRLYGWSHEHGRVIGQAAGLEVVQLRVR